MKLVKSKVLIIGLLICLFIPILSACDGINPGYEMGISRDYIIYDSIAELAQEATDVIRGEVLDVRVELRNTVLSEEEFLKEISADLSEEEIIYTFGEDMSWMDFSPRYEVVTVHRVRVLEVFQGNYQIGDITEVMQPGGTYGDMSVGNSSLISFEAGDDIVFFIYSRTHMGRGAVLLNPFQSAYRFPTIDENARNLDLDVELENVSGDTHFNDLSITLNDLLQLAEDQY